MDTHNSSTITVRIATVLPAGIRFEGTPAHSSISGIGNVDGVAYHHIIVRGPNIAKNRNNCIKKDSAMFVSSLEFDKILYVDSDVEFTKRDFEKIVKSDLPIVSGVLRHRLANRFIAGYWVNGLVGNGRDLESIDSEKPFVVDYVGGGFLCVSADVLKKIQYPYFRHEMVYHKDGVRAGQTDEDWGFCINAKKHGYDTYIDPTIILKHHNMKGQYMSGEEQQKQDMKVAIMNEARQITKSLNRILDYFEQIEPVVIQMSNTIKSQKARIESLESEKE